MSKKLQMALVSLAGFCTLALLSEAIITVQIGGATRLSSLSRQRDRYCYWDCDLVGCQIARDDDECAYDCEKICRVRYDYSARTGANLAADDQLKPKAIEPTSVAASGATTKLVGGNTVKVQANDGRQLSEAAENEIAKEAADFGKKLGAGTSVRLHLPRNATARNFAIWERCLSDGKSGEKLEMPFSL